MLIRAIVPILAWTISFLSYSALASSLDNLSRYDRDGELITLGQGDNAFQALKRDALTPQTKGVAILVPDWSVPPSQQQGVGYLSELMPNHGWVTIAITAPPQLHNPNYTSPLEKPEEIDTAREAPTPAHPIQADEWLNDEIREEQSEAYLTQIIARMDATVEESSKHPGFYLVIAQGSSAGWLTQLYEAKRLGPPDALINIGAYLPQHQMNIALAEAMAKTDIPVLDIYTRYDNRWVQDTVTLRPQLANKHFKLHYRQRELFGDVDMTRTDERLWKEIYGWLTYLGW
ncbi:DUF3530 family protein [Corallincola platygyrae]|uniref:DUF3530 family protein n=1 Tax=Corallincola platygyrae TaxID=1193278 RepID=A0ABW4XPQ5_9GAMM